jgi:Cu2+-containing amine oxidase
MNFDYQICTAYIEASTGNGNANHNEWSSHPIKGVYEVVKIEETKIYLRDDKITFPVLKTRVVVYEPKEKMI